MDELMFFIYLVITEFGLVYPIPGKGNAANSTYRVWWLRVSNNVSVRIDRHEGPGEIYGEIRVITIPITSIPNGKMLDYDFNNYDNVVRYFGL